jgi:hypothetical protein
VARNSPGLDFVGGAAAGGGGAVAGVVDMPGAVVAVVGVVMVARVLSVGKGAVRLVHRGGGGYGQPFLAPRPVSGELGGEVVAARREWGKRGSAEQDPGGCAVTGGDADGASRTVRIGDARVIGDQEGDSEFSGILAQESLLSDQGDPELVGQGAALGIIAPPRGSTASSKSC